MSESFDLGHLIEGVVEQDPMTDRFVIRAEQLDGSVRVFDVQEALAVYVGQEVRLTLASFETIDRLASMIESGKGSNSV